MPWNQKRVEETRLQTVSTTLFGLHSKLPKWVTGNRIRRSGIFLDSGGGNGIDVQPTGGVESVQMPGGVPIQLTNVSGYTDNASVGNDGLCTVEVEELGSGASSEREYLSRWSIAIRGS